LDARWSLLVALSFWSNGMNELMAHNDYSDDIYFNRCVSLVFVIKKISIASQ